MRCPRCAVEIYPTTSSSMDVYTMNDEPPDYKVVHEGVVHQFE